MTNVWGSYCVFNACQENKVKRVIHISTDEVYGSVANGFSKETDDITTSSVYSASKAASDLLALSFYKTYGTPIIITRSSNNFGPYQFPEKVIPLFITNLMENKKVPLYGTGANIRDWIYVLDNCSGIQTVIEKGIPGQVYNIGGGTLITNKELTYMILNEFGMGEEMVEFVEDRLGHDLRYALDSSKVGKLGWSPEYKFNDALKSTVSWYKNHEEWWRQLKK
jgi:dTDP-glucose 4,6-dehydratase